MGSDLNGRGNNGAGESRTGQNRTEQNITWTVGTGEDTKMPSNYFDLVTFGSSFNVCDRQAALLETKRILKSNGWFACMWNHRDLNDKLQSEIENILKKNISDYDYGIRREDQMNLLKQSGIFTRLEFVEEKVIHTISVEDIIEAWKSHGTVYRQAKERFNKIIMEITDLLQKESSDKIQVPYWTRIWIGQVKK